MTRLFERALIRLSPLETGEDVPGFLQGLVTNDVKGALPVWSALLTAQGKVMFDFFVWPDASGGLLIDCEAAQADALAKRLTLYRLRRKIGIERADGLGVFWQNHPGDGGANDPRLAALGQRWIAAVSEDDSPADEAWLAHRLSLGVAEGQAELGNGEVLWLECNAVDLNGVSFTKGCYVGQENTARMNWRQKVNRRLVVVPLAESDPSRQRAAYPDLGLAVDHRRVEDIAPALAPAWMSLTVAD
ncbi:MAG: folate-binding protein YgfZ [Novosphingobium sp. 17-62-19]|uniref:CAF17-like 4Fe-4S cluster assembly/insertion protein YgfZ n=1 Tax=Novosphingobium sp. 17-62-19 TaxID=1970406 RepID=UPI000BC3C937|nr:folate-binding protein [Novosphingobium sp. 17-62-19]OZA20939.1 MAG: folate-binding protein YgfZ [Novosphingobium sp. 17-62-19]HQS97012.1 folate-binding protein [Novosphingobium sp.]